MKNDRFIFIKIATYPHKPDTDGKGVIDGWQDKNKNGKCIVDYNASEWEFEEAESDAVFGFYNPSFTKKNVTIGKIFLYPWPEGLISDEYQNGNGEPKNQTTIIFNRGSKKWEKIKLTISPSYLAKINDGNNDYMLNINLNSVSLKIVSTLNNNDTGKLEIIGYIKAEQKRKMITRQDYYYEDVFGHIIEVIDNKIKIYPSKSELNGVEYYYKNWISENRPLWQWIQWDPRLFVKDIRGTRFLMMDSQSYHMKWPWSDRSAGNVLITMNPTGSRTTNDEIAYYDAKIKQAIPILQWGGFNVYCKEYTGNNIYTGINSDFNDFKAWLYEQLSSREYVLWIDRCHGYNPGYDNLVSPVGWKGPTICGDILWYKWEEEKVKTINYKKQKNEDITKYLDDDFWQVETYYTTQCWGGYEGYKRGRDFIMEKFSQRFYIGFPHTHNMTNHFGSYDSEVVGWKTIIRFAENFHNCTQAYRFNPAGFFSMLDFLYESNDNYMLNW